MGIFSKTPFSRQVLAEGEKEKEEKESGTQVLDSNYPKPLAKLTTGTPITVDNIRGEDATAKILARGFAEGLVKRPHMDSLLTASYNIVMTQLDKLLTRVAAGEELTSTEARTMGEYVKMIRSLGSEEREQRKADKVSEMSDANLLKTLGLSPDDLEDADV